MPDIIRPLETVSGACDETFATRHLFGWAVSGPVSTGSGESKTCFRTHVQRLDDIEHRFEHMYAKDFIDLEPDSKVSSFEDKLWLEKVESSIKKRNGHFEIALPFRDENVVFPDNYRQALVYLSSLRRRFVSSPSFHDNYKAFVHKLISNGHLEKVPAAELCTEPGTCWFLVHHGVYHQKKRKIRVVFNCSKKNAEISLNDTLLGGPDLINNLVGVLLRFRENKIAIMGDIESMFMQVKVPAEHCDFMRVLWYPDGDLSATPIQYRLTSHTFGAVFSPSIANYALKQAAKNCRNSVTSDSYDTIMTCVYVNDVMCIVVCT